MTTHERGRIGEDTAAAFLIQKGYRILKRNFRSPRGEVDIVCETGTTLVFVEVKTRRSCGTVAEEVAAIGRAVHAGKQRRIIGAARWFLRSQPRRGERSVRFDVMVVLPDAGVVRHIEGAFESAWAE